MHYVNLADVSEGATSHDGPIRKRVMLKRGDIPGVMQFARAVFPAGAAVEAHSHADMTEVFLCDGGRGVITVDGRDVVLEAGVCVAVQPGEVHALRADAAGEMVLTYWSVLTPADAG